MRRKTFAIPRRNVIQRTAGILLVFGSIVAVWNYGALTAGREENVVGIAESLVAFGFLIGVWLFAASFVYPKSRG